MSEHHSHVLTPVSWAKHTQTGIERSVMTFFLSAVISVLQYTTALMWCLIKSQKTFSFIPSTHIFKYLRNNFLGKVKVRLWMFKNLEHFQRQCQTGNKTQTRPVWSLWAENQTVSGTKGTAFYTVSREDAAPLSPFGHGGIRNIHCQNNPTAQ